MFIAKPTKPNQPNNLSIRQTDKQTDRQTSKQTNNQSDNQANRQTDKQTNNQSVNQANRQTNNQSDKYKSALPDEPSIPTSRKSSQTKQKNMYILTVFSGEHL